MRKFTLFLAMMVAMVTTSFAQGSEVIDIASNADAMLYSNAPCKVTTWGDDFKGWHVLFDDNASTFFHSDYSGDDSVDGLDHYLRVDMGEGNSVSLFTFTFTTRNTNCEVNSPTTIVVEGSNEADGTYTEIATLTGLPTTNSTVYTSETLGSEDVAYRYIRYRVTETLTNQKQGGHVFFFIAEFGMSKVKAGAVLANINYTYTYNGETIGSATASAYVGDAYPEPANVPFGYHAATPEGTVEGDKDITIECTLKLPFEYAESVDAIKTWYYMQMHSNNKRYIQYLADQTYLEWADAEVAEGEEDSYTWAFVGTPATGFKLVNRAAGTELAVCSDGSNNPALGAFADAVYWTPAASDIPGEAHFCLQYPGSSNYMNAQDGKVAYWNDNDAGSTFLLTKREIAAVEPEPVAFEVAAVTPSEAVEKFSEFTIEFTKDIVVDWGTSNGTGGTGNATGGTGDATGGTGNATGGTGNATGGTGDATGGTDGAVSSIKVKDANGGNIGTIWTSQAVVNGNKITFKLESAITKSGVYTVQIPAGCIESVDGEKYAGETFTFTVDAAPALTSKTTVNVDNTLSVITAEFDAEIEFAAESDVTVLNVYVQNTETVAATITVANNAAIEGNVLTLTLDEAIAPEGTTKYTIEIPAGWIVKKGTDKAFAGKKLTYTVKIPFTIKNITPASGSTVETIESIVIEYNEKVMTYGTKTMLENVEDGTQVEVTVTTNDNVATITPNAPVANGTYKLVNLGYIVSNSSWNAPATLPEYTITVNAPVVELEALEAVSYDRNPLETALNGQYKLQGVKINFGEVVKKYTKDLTGDYGYILDAEGNEVARLNKCMGGNGTSNDFATPYSATAIETPGTYKVVVLPGVIFNADGTKEYKGGEFEFTVAERAVEISPSAEEGFCWNETFENVADFSEFVITVKYAKSDVVINNDVKATMTTGETVYEAAVTVEKSGNTQYITLAFNGEFAEGKYSINVPAGLFTVDGVANEEYAQSTFTYKKPQLEITRDFDSWESYLDQVWYMPKGAIITIANAESVEVDETKVATIAVGESVYKSTLSYYYDDLSNAHYIELTFEDFFAESFEFVKGDYTFTLPAGLYTVNGVANEEVVKTYTYGDPIVEEFTVTEILPVPGSTLESLDAISITFSNGMKPDMLPITCGEKTYYFIYKQGLYVAVDLMSYEPIVITEPGTYTLDLSELEGLTGDKVFSWTIAEAVEPEPGVNYTPTYTGTKTRTGRDIITVSINDNSYELTTDEQTSCYVDATETVTFTVVAGTTVKANVEYQGEWMHHSVYIDFDGDGFTSGIEEGSEWKPAGDLVAYSFYNNGGSLDENGYNSVGTYMSGMDRHVPEIPEFVAPTEPGLYRIRFVQDWCSIDPNGDSDGKFDDFMANGGQIVDLMLEVTVADGISEIANESAADTIYDLTGRKIETITKGGIYIVNGKKVLVK